MILWATKNGGFQCSGECCACRSLCRQWPSRLFRMSHRRCRMLIHRRSEMRPEPTSKRCGAEDSVGALEPDFSAARSSAARWRHTIGTAMATPTTGPTPIMDPTADTVLRTPTITVIAEDTPLIGSSVVAFDLVRERWQRAGRAAACG